MPIKIIITLTEVAGAVKMKVKRPSTVCTPGELVVLRELEAKMPGVFICGPEAVQTVPQQDPKRN